jgi:hypothetical protein
MLPWQAHFPNTSGKHNLAEKETRTNSKQEIAAQQ